MYPLLDAGADMPATVPPMINLDVFREAYWKQVRMLYLLFQRDRLRVQKDVLSRIAAYLAAPIRAVRFDATAPWDVTPLPMPALPFTSLLMPLSVC
jgi:hypothetical protein